MTAAEPPSSGRGRATTPTVLDLSLVSVPVRLCGLPAVRRSPRRRTSLPRRRTQRDSVHGNHTTPDEDVLVLSG